MTPNNDGNSAIFIWYDESFFVVGDVFLGYTWDINTNIILTSYYDISIYIYIYHILSSYHPNMIYGMGRRMDLPSHRPPMPVMPGVETGAAAAGDEAQRHWWHEWVWWWRWCGCCSCSCSCSCCCCCYSIDDVVVVLVVVDDDDDVVLVVDDVVDDDGQFSALCTTSKDDVLYVELWSKMIGETVLWWAPFPGVCPWKSHQRCLARPGKPRQISVVWMKCSRNCTNIRSSHLVNYETNC